MIKNLITAIILVFLTACAPSGSKDNKQKVEAQDLEYRAKQMALFKPLLGYYRGTINTDSVQKTVSLEMFTVEEPASPFPDGSERYVLALKASLKFLSPVEESVSFSVRYIPETGDLIFINEDKTQNIPSNGADNTYDIHTMNTQFKSERIGLPSQIAGEVKSLSGFYGIINLDMAQRPSNGGSNDEEQYYERQRQEFKAVEGEFRAKNFKNGKLAYKFHMKFQIVSDIENPKKPVLIGQFYRDDDIDREQPLLTLTATYQPELNPPKLTVVAKAAFANPDYQALFIGTLENGFFRGQWQSTINGYEGDFVAEKVSKSPKENADKSSPRPPRNPRRNN